MNLKNLTKQKRNVMSRKSCNLGKKTSVLAINPELKIPSFQSAGVLGDIFQGRSISKFATQNANK
jgi:hypothetical protein